MIFIGALTKSKEFEIRLRYEFGENLKKLSIIYKVPLSTLKARKRISENKGDPWIKGSREKEAYKRFTENDIQRKKEIEEKINSVAREELNQLQEIINDAYADGKVYADEVEGAVSIRANRIDKFLALRRKVENIPTQKEEAEIERLKIESELKRLELEDKRIELELKKYKSENELEIIKLKKNKLEKEVSSRLKQTILLE